MTYMAKIWLVQRYLTCRKKKTIEITRPQLSKKVKLLCHTNNSPCGNDLQTAEQPLVFCSHFDFFLTDFAHLVETFLWGFSVKRQALHVFCGRRFENWQLGHLRLCGFVMSANENDTYITVIIFQLAITPSISITDVFSTCT